ncbi:polymorphic toxin-type HINT domain-containing protein [Actinoplanes sp. NPDC051861]|uniref:polymorphic toxin-type HINT domain-containing protein n=1 Tax=Actinoplanes sp. NPDC051861 TaxID=3155170 RepID=UPI00342204EF
MVGQFSGGGSTLSGSTTFDPLGRVVASTGAVGNLGFQQEYTEPATGRVNMHARWYNPETGQFDTRDSANLSPVGQSANANRYGYGNGNPLAGTDPSGHSFLSMSSCNSTFTCMLKGFVNAFDIIESAKSVINAVSNVKAAIERMAATLESEAKAWKSKIGGAIFDRVDCGDWVIGSSYCRNLINGVAAAAGAGCALSGVCAILDDCLVKPAKLACAEQVGGILAGAVMALLTGGAGLVLQRVTSRINSLLKKFNLPDRRKKKGGSGGGGLSPADEKRIVLANPATPNLGKKHGDNGSGAITCKSSKCRKGSSGGGGSSPGNGGSGPKKGGNPPAPKFPSVKRPATGPADDRKDKSVRDGDDGPANPGRDIPTADVIDAGSLGYDDRRDYGTSSCPKKHSFDPDTRVLMADGSTKAIAEVDLGDEVTATDPQTGETAARPVTVLHENLDTELTDVTVSATPPAADGEQTGEGKGGRSTRGPTGSVLETTQNHPFWDDSVRDWVDAADLKPGTSTLIGPNGETQHVTAVRNYTSAKQMHDLTVDITHTYYVVAAGGPILVHNNDCGGGDVEGDERVVINPATGRFDSSWSNYDKAMKYVTDMVGDLGVDVLLIYDFDPISGQGTGTLIGIQTVDKQRGWRVDNDKDTPHINWWNWTGGKKGAGGIQGHAWLPKNDLSVPGSRGIGDVPELDRSGNIVGAWPGPGYKPGGRR